MKKKVNISKLLIYIVLLSGVLIAVFPFVWMFLTSFKTNTEAMAIPATILPKKIRFDSFISIFEKLPFLKIYLNTIISALVTVAAQLTFCAMAGYAYARINFPFKNILFTATLAVLMVPGTFFILPQYRLMYSMKLLNTIPALFLPNLFSAMGTFLLRQFFLSLPQELEDAAYIDGCNRGKAFLRIMLPLVKPGLVSLGILTFRLAWNDLMWPLLVTGDTKMRTLANGLALFIGSDTTEYGPAFAGAVCSILPMLLLYIFGQRYFVEGTVTSGLKG